MKTTQRRSLFQWAACFVLLLAILSPESRALDPKPPGKMAFQGFLTDSSGVARGASSPVNLTITFRIYNSSTASASQALWAESQVVTVDKGHFSVVLGEGTPVAGPPPATDLTDLFIGDNSNGRYLGITVESEAEIAPRIQFLGAPYAHLARYATELVGSSGSSLLKVSSDKVGINVAGIPASALEVNGVVTATQYNGNGAGLTSLNANQLTTGTVPDARLSLNVARRDVANTFTGNQQVNSGRIGIGVAPLEPLHIDEATGTPHNFDNGTILLDHENNGGASSIVFRSRVNRGGGDAAWIQYQDAATLNGSGEASILSIGTSNDGDDNMALMPSGRLGIGTMSPRIYVDVAGGQIIGSSYTSVGQHDASNRGIKVSFGSTLDNGGEFIGMSTLVTAGTQNCGNSGDIYFNTWECNTSTSREVMRINGSGNVGIGTGSPSARLHVNGFTYSNHAFTFYARGSSGANTGNSSGTVDYSILASNRMGASEFNSFSDERIKDILGRSNDAADLETLMHIEITDFRYKDTVSKGKGLHKKVIAQQVEKVYPQAVRGGNTEVVPDIYKVAKMTNGWVQLKTDLKTGDRVKLMVDVEKGDGDQIVEVTEVSKDHDKFRTSLKADVGQVFVYGREVKDFRSVDYDEISMLNVSATQFLKKEKDEEVKSLRQENLTLRDRVQVLEKLDKAREEELSNLKKAVQKLAGMLQPNGKVVAATDR